jgi:hypothetical protein
LGQISHQIFQPWMQTLTSRSPPGPDAGVPGDCGWTLPDRQSEQDLPGPPDPPDPLHDGAQQ